MDPYPWRQVNVVFPNWAAAEQTAAAHLAPLMTEAETEGLITAWFFIRKAPCWRLRYLPGRDAAQADAHLRRRLEDLKSKRHINDVRHLVYEPETHAFGGPEAMQVAHELFHRDSRNVLAQAVQPSPALGRREMAVLLSAMLMRAAGLDWYEQGDVWVKVAEHRPDEAVWPPEREAHLSQAMRRLLTVDVRAMCDAEGAPLAAYRPWVTAFEDAGQALADLAAQGRLLRGLRAVLAHHLTFHANRAGLPSSDQSAIAALAIHTVFNRFYQDGDKQE
ncbi:thiopeptide-type bacteriocin biosynthesis protein [Microbispora sp. RL4-1S]|uniref:Thiopeptide-type bacteriocin biosynthesis protein n=1 Tax=Microbispora oryzae TaxID=2806554 RepID=A0A940WTZ7_9ACTN|nr:thiopeptide-type bacteriocin biosynthesis protein [Microbispora oryzae]MBP2707385.1 thiopeptide-type bacteriocin biosynthesis protein [Microbispora oryzae]